MVDDAEMVDKDEILKLLEPSRVWESCELAPREDWNAEAGANDTNIGYREWALSKLEDEGYIFQWTLGLKRAEQTTFVRITSRKPLTDAELLADLQAGAKAWVAAMGRQVEGWAGWYELSQNVPTMTAGCAHVLWLDFESHDTLQYVDWNTALYDADAE
jgi:hypothetical protein